jgi:hypothetical protein
MAADLLSLFVDELAKLFEPVTDVVENPALLARLLAEIGAESDTAGGDALAAALSAIATLVDDAKQLAANPSPSFGDIAGVLAAVGKAFEALRALSHAGGPAEQLENFGTDLADFLVASYLMRSHPLARQIAALLTLIELEETQELQQPVMVAGQVVRGAYRIDRFHLDRISHLLGDPIGTLRAAYVTPLVTVADANAMADKLFPRIRGLLRELDVPCRYGFRAGDEPLLGDAAPIVDHALIVWAADKLMGATDEAGVVFTLSPAERGDLGLLASPFGALQVQTEVGSWTIELDVTAEVEGVAYGRHGVTLLASPGTAEVNAKFTATLEAPDKGPAFVLGSPNASRIEVGGSIISAQTALSEAQQSLAISAAVSKAAIFIMPGDGDGFLQKVLPANGLQAKFDLGIGWSNKRGLYFRGSAGLDATLPVGISIGGILTVPSVHLALQASNAAVVAEVSVSVGLSIGPLQALVDRVGMTGTLTFPDDGGNLGVMDLAFAFKPPNGVGLSLDAGGFKGGGFLRLDSEKGEYVGALELDFNNLFSVKAIGIINTKMPDGSKGFSLLIVISAEFTPIQLSFGFTLNGVGGIFGLNRRIAVAALAEGIRTNAVKSILFPENIVANITRIISDIKQFFPQQRDHFVIGPMAKLAWGTSSMITVELGLLLDLPDPMFAIVGVLKALLPDQEAPILKLQVNFIGVVDFDRGYIFFRADLFDSRLLAYSITGSMAFLVSWGEAKALALSVGGFHPDFRDIPCIPALPDGFRHMARIGISLLSDDNPRLKAESYFAVTSNTVQFGARVELYAEESGFNIYGFLGFDVLFQFDPFHFIAKLSGGVALRRHSSVIAGVNISATLTGPTPWDARGKATLSFLFFSISVGFHATWGDSLLAIAGAFEDLLKVLQRELDDTRNWRADLPPNNHLHVSLRKIELPAATDMLVIHPAGVLTFSQRSLPLEDFAIQKFGDKKPLAENKFKLGSANSGGAEIPADYQGVREQFAPANFLELSDSEKLSRKSFDNLPSGFKLTATADLLTTLPVVRDVIYELSYLRRQRIGPKSLVDLVVVAYDRLVKGSAVRQSRLAQQQTRVSLNAPPQVELLQETFVIANAADLKSHVTNASGPVFFNSQAEAYQQQQELIAQNPALAGQIQVVSNFELNLN